MPPRLSNPLLSLPSRNANTPSLISSPTKVTDQQVRHATFIPRPKRPYTFTQLLTLSDGSAYLHRTTSPLSIYQSSRDTRNSPMWNPSSAKLASVEEDEAGRLRAFRRRFGRGFDTVAAKAEAETAVDQGGVEMRSEAPLASDGATEAEGQRMESAQGRTSRSTISQGKESARQAAEAKTDKDLASKGEPATLVSEQKATTQTWSEPEEEEEDDNLMDLISQAGTRKKGGNKK